MAETSAPLLIALLRRNLAIEADLTLAKTELEALTGASVETLTGGLGELEPDPASCAAALIVAPESRRPEGAIALSVEISSARPSKPPSASRSSPKSLIAMILRLTRRAAFLQALILRLGSRAAEDALLERLRADCGPVAARIGLVDGGTALLVIPHFCLIELASLVSAKTSSTGAVAGDLAAASQALLGAGTPRGRRLAAAALARKAPIAPLGHDLHYYKAKFFPRLARAWLNITEARLDGGARPRVLDPFCGSGTTQLEAALLSAPALGADLDPLSVRIAAAKQSLLTLASEDLERARRSIATALESDRPESRPAPPWRFPDWLLKNRRMTPELADSLGREIEVGRSLVAAAPVETRSLMRVLWSDAASRRLRMRFLGTGVGRFSLTLARRTAPEMILAGAAHVARVAACREWLLETLMLRPERATLIQGDARRLPIAPGSIDLILTSPPYLPASSGRESYARARAAPLLALGLRTRAQLEALEDTSIGSMAKLELDRPAMTTRTRELVDWLAADSLRGPKAGPSGRYFLEMRAAFREMARVLRPGGRAVVVSGKQSTFYEFKTRKPLYVVPAAEMLAEEAELAGLEVVDLIDVQLSKSNRNARPRSLDDYYETLIELRRRP